MDPRTPVLIGAARVTSHEADPAVAVEAVELMIRASGLARDDSGCGRALERVGLVAVPKGIWSYPDPGALVAERLGISGAATAVAEVGITQQALISRAAERIAAGELHAALIVGGEAKFRSLRAAVTATTAPETPQIAEPDETWLPKGDILAPVEIQRELAVPAHQYAVIESALRHARGLDSSAQRELLGRLGASFAAVAAADPLAWDRSSPPATVIATPGPGNRMVASPYTKLLCSQWNVDQAVALILTSVGEARRLGVQREQWVFPLCSAGSEAMLPLTTRAELHRSPATSLTFAALLGRIGLDAPSITHLDLYSCFPAAVQVQALELGIGLDRPLTVSGGMTFGGGPLNSAALQSVAAMALALRADPGAVGLVTAFSGMLTKPAAGLWSTTDPDRPFAHIDVTQDAISATTTRPLDAHGVGDATVVGSTVIHVKGVPDRSVAIVELDDGRRTVVVDQDPAAAVARVDLDLVGQVIAVHQPGRWGET